MLRKMFELETPGRRTWFLKPTRALSGEHVEIRNSKTQPGLPGLGAAVVCRPAGRFERPHMKAYAANGLRDWHRALYVTFL